MYGLFFPWLSWLFFLSLIGTFITGLFVLFDNFDSEKDHRLRKNLFLANLLLFVVFVISTNVINSNIAKLDETEFRQETFLEEQLYAITNGTDIDAEASVTGKYSAHFAISSSDTYRYYYKEGDNYRQGSIPAENTYIRFLETDDEAPRVIGYHEYEFNRYQYGNNIEVDKYHRINERTCYYLLLPEGSIVESFTLN